MERKQAQKAIQRILECAAKKISEQSDPEGLEGKTPTLVIYPIHLTGEPTGQRYYGLALAAVSHTEEALEDLASRIRSILPPLSS